MRYGECYVALRSQRTNHVLHYEYTSTGENLPFLEEEYEVATENGGFQMNGRWSDNPIVLQKSGNADGGKGIAQAIMENPDILILDEPMNGLDNQVYEMDHGKLAVSE